MIPIAASVMLAGGIVISTPMTRTRTHSGKVHQARKGGDPVVHIVNKVETIQLMNSPLQKLGRDEFYAELTKSPSASHWFRGNITLGTTLIAVVEILN